MRIGYYPGTFDPITYGHLDIISRASKLFDKLYVSVAYNTIKNPLFTTDERVALVRKVLKDIPNIEVVQSNMLTVEHCRILGADHIVRGLRAVTDYDYEFQLTNINREINPEVDTVFLMTLAKYSFLSSSSVRELAQFGGDVSSMVPDAVKEAIDRKFKKH